MNMNSIELMFFMEDLNERCSAYPFLALHLFVNGSEKYE